MQGAKITPLHFSLGNRDPAPEKINIETANWILTVKQVKMGDSGSQFRTGEIPVRIDVILI